MATTPVIQPRPLRGSRISSFYPVKSLPSLSSLDSAFQLQEYISLLIRLNVHDVDTITKMPAHAGVDENCWIYEQLRRLAQDLSHPLITMLQAECTRETCRDMKAGEWLYLCVAHGNDGAMERCCAIDYILHTLDSATALLNSPRAFPSRLQIPQSSRRHFSSLARRLGRIFAHAYFHHRELFEQAEAESSLYARFLKLVETFNLVPAEFLVIPATRDVSQDEQYSPQPPKLYGAALHSDDPPSVYPTRDEGSVNQSPSPPSSGDESPRKPTGRSRTDTMVYSDTSPFILEELASKSPTQNPLDSARQAVLELDITPASSAPPPETKTASESLPQHLQEAVEIGPTETPASSDAVVDKSEPQEAVVAPPVVEESVPDVEKAPVEESSVAEAVPSTVDDPVSEAPKDDHPVEPVEPVEPKDSKQPETSSETKPEPPTAETVIAEPAEVPEEAAPQENAAAVEVESEVKSTT